MSGRGLTPGEIAILGVDAMTMVKARPDSRHAGAEGGRVSGFEIETSAGDRA